MKTLKISEETHKKLTKCKSIYGNTSFDELIRELIESAIEHDFEYSNITLNEYQVLKHDK